MLPMRDQEMIKTSYRKEWMRLERGMNILQNRGEIRSEKNCI